VTAPGLACHAAWRRSLLPAALALWCLSRPLAAQDAVLQGRVLQADARTPIAGAEVAVRQTGSHVETDSTGRFSFHGFPAGPVELLVRRIGFQAVTLSLVLDAGETRAVEVLLTPAIATLDEITVTPTADARSLADVAAAVSVADTLDIRRDRTVGLDEALRMMPGVQANARYGTDDVNLGIRGSGARARQAVRGVAVLLDGVALTEPDGVSRLDMIELAAARKIEVVRGPISALYAGSANGAINIISRSGYDSPGVSLLAEGGSYGFQKYEGQAGGALANGRGSAFAAGSYTVSDNYRDHSDGQVARGLLRTDYRLFSRTSLSLDAAGSNLDTRLPGELTLAQSEANPDTAAPSAVAWNFGRADTRYRVGARALQGLDASGNVSASGYFYYGGRTLDFPIPFQVVDLNLHRSQLGARVGAARVGGAAVQLAGGVDYDNVYGTDQRWDNVGGAHGTKLDNGTLSVPSLGIYAQGEWQAGRTVDLTLGLRYDNVSYHYTSDFPGQIPSQDKVYQQWSPKGTVSWQVGAPTQLYGSIARGFEVPAIGELGGLLPGDAIDSTLQPKSLWNYEVGARGHLGRRLEYDAAVFYADITGEFVPQDQNGISQPENASHSRNFGIELAATAALARWLDLGATYTYSDFRLLDYATAVVNSTGVLQPAVYNGNLLPGIPQHRVTAEVVTRPLPALSLGVRFDWQSLVYVETGNQAEGVTYFHLNPAVPASPVIAVPFRAVPARAIFQLNGRYQLGPVGLFGVVENLFGTRYTANVVANSQFGTYYDPGSGTWVTLGATVSLWPKGF